MNKFALLTNQAKDSNFFYTHMITDYILENGRQLWMPGQSDETDSLGPGNDSQFDLTDMPEDADCVIVLGGDGTLLSVAREVYERGVPIFGINMGTLGFLTSAEKSEVPMCLDQLFDDSYTVENRAMLRGAVFEKDEKVMDNSALNDIIITRSGYSRLVELMIYVNGVLMSVYDADGVIISTPTGSTGYNLSAGGPVVFPMSNVIIVTPICPHSLQARSIVVSGDDHITVEVGKRRKTQKGEVMVTYDGQEARELSSGDRIKICRAQETTHLVVLKGRNFYQVLQSKIGNA